MDILGPFPMAPRQRKFLLVMIDYFTKWFEIEPLANIITQSIQKFFWNNFITYFRILNTLVTNNGQQFTDWKLNKFLSGLGIRNRVKSMEHPQTNGQAKTTNKIIPGELRKQLDEARERWVEELAEVLWVYICTPHSTTQETPFWLTYSFASDVWFL